MTRHQSDRGKFGALVWKELRETFIWGLPALVLAGMFAMQWACSHWDGPTVVLWIVPFGIGLSQVRRECQGDAWGFLIHRPVRRTTLFWGKVTAGLAIYLFSTGVPLLIAALWIATPGHLDRPFGWRTLLPHGVTLLTGLLYYFAAMYGGMRPWRWYPNLGIACVMALAVSTAAAMAQALVPALVLIVAGAIVMAVAARTAFMAGAQYQPAGRAAPAIAAGLGLAFALFFGAPALVSSFATDPLPQGERKTYGIAGDGTIATPDENARAFAVRDLEGRRIERYKNAEELSDGVAEIQLSLFSNARDAFYVNEGDLEAVYPPFWGDHWLELPIEHTWYYVRSLALLAEYDVSSRLIGWLGPAGYSRGPIPPASRLEGELIGPTHYTYKHNFVTMGEFSHPLVLGFPAAVYRVDLQYRRIAAIFKAPAGESVVAAGTVKKDEGQLLEHGDRARFDVIATTRAIYVQGPDGTSLVTVLHDPQAADYGSVRIVHPLKADRTPWFIWYQQFVRAPSIQPDQVTAFNKDGVPNGHFTLPRLLSIEPTSRAPALAAAAVLPVTVPAVTTLLNAFGATPLHYNNLFNSNDAPEFPRVYQIVDWVIPSLASLVSAALIFALGRKYAFPGRQLWLWTGSGILLGPAGFVLMLLVREWPAFESCHSCGRNRIVTRVHCEYCGAPFSPPEPDGAEIVEHVG